MKETQERLSTIDRDLLADVLSDLVNGDPEGTTYGFDSYEAAKSLQGVIARAKDDREIEIIDAVVVALIGESLESLLSLIEEREEEAGETDEEEEEEW